MHLAYREFQRLLEQALTGLPPEFQEALENVAILSQSWPSLEQIDLTGTNDHYGLLGLYQGVSLPDRGSYDMVLPDTITLFRRPIQAQCRTRAELEAEVRTTLLHEIAHYLGWGEEEMRRLGVE